MSMLVSLYRREGLSYSTFYVWTDFHSLSIEAVFWDVLSILDFAAFGSDQPLTCWLTGIDYSLCLFMSSAPDWARDLVIPVWTGFAAFRNHISDCAGFSVAEDFQKLTNSRQIQAKYLPDAFGKCFGTWQVRAWTGARGSSGTVVL